MTGRSRSLVPPLAIGLIAGTLSGLLGVGGGVVIVPALMFAAAVPQRVATATSLAAVAPIAIVGSVLFGSSGNVEVGNGRGPRHRLGDRSAGGHENPAPGARAMVALGVRPLSHRQRVVLILR